MNDRKIVSSGCERPGDDDRADRGAEQRVHAAARRPARARRSRGRAVAASIGQTSPARVARVAAQRCARGPTAPIRASPRSRPACPRYWNDIGMCSTVSSLPQPAIARLMPYQTSAPSTPAANRSTAASAARRAPPVELVDELGDRHLRAAPRRAGAAEERHPDHQQLGQLGDPGEVLADHVQHHVGEDQRDHHRADGDHGPVDRGAERRERRGACGAGGSIGRRALASPAPDVGRRRRRSAVVTARPVRLTRCSRRAAGGSRRRASRRVTSPAALCAPRRRRPGSRRRRRRTSPSPCT